jgi:hypothetical protein
MPFPTDTNWPQGLLNIFDVCCRPKERLTRTPLAVEARYYGPYDKLLNYAMIEGSFAFFLAPQAVPDERYPHDALAFIVFLVVFNKDQKPVLFAMIQNDGWATSPLMRQRADTLMRQQYEQLLYDSPIRHLYGLSFLGTSLRVYCGDKDTGKITSDFVGDSKPDVVLPRDFLEGEWDIDVLSPDGLKKMQEIAAYIKANVVK